MPNSSLPNASHYTTPRELELIHAGGVHFVICRQNKAAIETGWQNKAASLDSVVTHYAGGGLLGFVPGRSGLWVLDIDVLPDAVVNAWRPGCAARRLPAGYRSH